MGMANITSFCLKIVCNASRNQRLNLRMCTHRDFAFALLDMSVVTFAESPRHSFTFWISPGSSLDTGR